MPTDKRRRQTPADTAAPAGPYVDRLDPEDRAAYQAAGDDLDLANEIRLMRAVLSRLAEDISANKTVLSATFNALIRAIAIQADKLGGTSDVEQALIDAAERVLVDGFSRDTEPA